MSQYATSPQGEDWLGLSRLAAVLAEHRTPAHLADQPVADREVVDRFNRTLEILALVEENANPLREHALHATEHDALRLASDLRRLANRLQTVGDFLAHASVGVLELEDQLLFELDERFRRQSSGGLARDWVDSRSRLQRAAAGG